MLPGRRHDISRLEAFSDAVFSFAPTLLVVSLDVVMGPAHWTYGVGAARRRRALKARLQHGAEPAEI